MITIGILLLLLQSAATPEQHGQSSFVDFDHTHEWIKLDEIKGGSVWGDKHLVGQVTDGEKVYPLVITRIVFDPGASPWGRIDKLHGVDCQSNQIATFKANVPRHPRHLTETPEFNSWLKPDSEGVGSIMRAACGEDWSV